MKEILTYLREHQLILTTAESCTAGQIIHLLGKYNKSGESLDTGYVVYSVEAKKRLLGVKQRTINKYTLTSEAVALEMVKGALKDSHANVGVATTGVAGPKPMDGIPPGTICFAWGFKIKDLILFFTETKQFEDTRANVLNKAAQHALINIPTIHKKLIKL